MTKRRIAEPVMSVSGAVLALRGELTAGIRSLGSFDMGDRHVDICAGSDAIWATIRRQGKGDVALRLAHCPGGPENARKTRPLAGERLRVVTDGATGRYGNSLRESPLDLGVLRATAELPPAADLLIPFHPRDL